MLTESRIRTAGAAALALTLAASLAACDTKGQHTMTARDGRDAVVEFVINSSKQLDITDWRPRSVAGAGQCSLGGGKEGASYSYDHWAPRGTDVEADAKRVADYWESLGMTVRTTNTTPHPTVYGSGGPVLRASFDTGAVENSYRIGAVMPCATGDAYELNIEDEATRNTGTVLPGDEGVIRIPDPRDQWKQPSPSTTPPPADAP